jgi:hypothetical protein
LDYPKGAVSETKKMMRLWVVILWVLVFASPSGTERSEAASSSTQLVSPSEGVLNERAALKYLWSVLDYGAKVSRIQYRGSCQLRPDAHPVISFPQLDVHPPSKGKSGVAAVRDIFRQARDISVTEADSGIIRVRIGSVPDAILRVRISNLALTPEEQFNYWLAIFKIENAPEVQSAMQTLKISIPPRPVSIGVVQPANGLAHLPGVIRNVTMDQALDLVAKTFRGIVLYGFCTPPDQYEIDFADAGYIYSTN